MIREIREILSSYLRKHNDDRVDRLHYLHTVICLSVYLLFITSKSYYGEPIQCVVNNFGEASKYIHSMCWINGTFHSKELDVHDINYNEKEDKMDYYQWMVFIILFQSITFLVPSYIWSFFIYLNGFDMVHVTKDIIPKLYLEEYEGKSWFDTRKVIENITDHLKLSFLNQRPIVLDYNDIDDSETHNILLDKSEMPKRKRHSKLKTKSTFPLYFPYLLVKLIYIGNIVFNFFFLTHVFNFNYFEYGIKATNLKLQDSYALDKEYFPKKGFCSVKFYGKKYFNVGSYVCSLPINLFNQLFYLGFWYWLFFLAFVTICSLINWLGFLMKRVRRQFVLRCLQLNKYNNLIRSHTAAYYLNTNVSFDAADQFFLDKTGIKLMDNFDIFFRDVCSIDLIFSIKLIELNSNKLASRDILNSLWDEFLDLEDIRVKQIEKRPVVHIRRQKFHSLTPVYENKQQEIESNHNKNVN